MKTKALILTGYGINAQDELAQAFVMAGADTEIRHVQDVVENPALLSGADYLGFPGGFSFGDHLGSGRVLANLFTLKLKKPLFDFVKSGGLIIGICNGFQTLVKTGLLPGIFQDRQDAGESKPAVSLIHNKQGSFIDTWVPVEFPADTPCVWTRGLEPRLFPIRHGEGRFVADAEVLRWLEAEKLVAVRYRENPNGSQNDIAGICDRSGRIFGLMPHPEASIHAEVHPERRRSHEALLGVDIFRNAVAYRERLQ